VVLHAPHFIEGRRMITNELANDLRLADVRSAMQDKTGHAVALGVARRRPSRSRTAPARA